MDIWAKDYMQNQVITKLGIVKNTVCEKFKDLKEISMDEILINEDMIFGGYDENGVQIELEIDESVFLKRKVNSNVG